MSEPIPFPLRIDPATRRLIPQFRAAGFVAHSLREPAVPAGDEAEHGLGELEQLPAEMIAQHPRLSIWRDSYRAMGLQPSTFRSSIEQLVRRRLAGQNVATGLWTVDLYNRISIDHLAPMGGYDLSAMSDEAFTVRPADPERDRFDPLGGDPARMPLKDRVICYAQGREICCWAINHRDARHSALKPETRSALFVSESVDTEGARASIDALETLRKRLGASGAVCAAVEEFAPA